MPSITDENIRALAVARDGRSGLRPKAAECFISRMAALRTSATTRARSTGSSSPSGRTAKRIWAATNRGLYRRHGDRFQRVDEPLHLPNIAFFALGQRCGGRMFAGGPEGLFCFENGELRRYGPRTEAEFVNQIRAAARTGTLWVATNRP